jgi:hypothetical protein
VNRSSTGAEHNVSTAVNDIKYCANRDGDHAMIDDSDEYCTVLMNDQSFDNIEESHDPANYNPFIISGNLRTGINPIHAAPNNYVDHGAELCTDLQQQNLHYDIKDDVAATANYYNGPRSVPPGCDQISNNIKYSAALHDDQVNDDQFPGANTCKYSTFHHRLIQYRSDHHQQLAEQPEQYGADDFNVNPIFCGQIRHTSSVLMNYSTASSSGSINCTIFSNNNNSSNNVVNNPCRVCAHCKTRKTPLWRNGPLGPKVYYYLAQIMYELRI